MNVRFETKSIQVLIWLSESVS